MCRDMGLPASMRNNRCNVVCVQLLVNERRIGVVVSVTAGSGIANAECSSSLA